MIIVALIPLARFDASVLARGRAIPVNAPSPQPTQDAVPAQDATISSASAAMASGGVLVQWRANAALESLRFRVYRMRSSRRTVEAVSAGSLSSVVPVRVHGGYSFQWLDPDGTVDTVYYIESINLNDRRNVHDAVIPVSRSGSPGFREATGSIASESVQVPQHVSEYPTSLAMTQAQLPEGAIENQWAVAAQTALKIQIKSDGWYRVTQEQMAAAGFNPTVDIRNLSLFGDGQDITIRTSKGTGQLTSGDFIEFYGRGLDTPDTDTRIYYLIAGTAPGKRSRENLQVDSRPDHQPPSQSPFQQTDSHSPDWTYRGLFVPLVNLINPEQRSETRSEEVKPVIGQSESSSTELSPSLSKSVPLFRSELPTNTPREKGDTKTEPDVAAHSTGVASAGKVESVSKARKNKKRTNSLWRRTSRNLGASKTRYNHSSNQAAVALSFDDTLQIKERFNYNGQLTLGHNFFGATMGTTFPLTQTLTVHSVQSSAAGPARLEIALQGISFQSHQVNISFNNVLIGTMTNFFGHDNLVQTFSIPVSQLFSGNNGIKLAPVAGGDFLGLDYIKLTYPHSFFADAKPAGLRAEVIIPHGSLRFSLDAAQSATIDGFTTSRVRLLDITDPSTVKFTSPTTTQTPAGYSITVPTDASTSGLRTFYALPEAEFATPAGFSLNQPSTLNASSNRADLLIVYHKDFFPSLAQLVTQRQGQGLEVLEADVEDVYDEFSFGAHSSQAVQDFISYASSHWTTKPPRYVMFAGDGSYDPRSHFSVAMTRANKGCTDTNNNAADFSLSLFGNAHNSGFTLNPGCSGSGGVVISQVYTGVGEKGGSYTNSFIELFNSGSAPVNLNGWSVQYADATGATWQVTNLSNVTIQPNHYYLVREASFGGIFPLPTPDAIENISMSATAGKIALVNSTTPLTGFCPTGASIVDFLGYGSVANCFEGSGPIPIGLDFVPTKQVDTIFGVACSDDGLGDFNNDGVPEIPVGRLPARTPAEANLMVSKIVSFSKANVPQNALLVADAQGTYYWNFESHSDDLGNLVPQTLTKQKIYLAQQSSAAACRTNIINAMNQGVALVNYQGHGNVNVWSGSSIFTADDARALTNGNRLPLVIVADCLNGLFDDPVLEGLAEVLLKAQNGGAVAAYASSGETIPDGQQDMSVRVFQLLFGSPSMALGDITKDAKAYTTDLDVRRTWILLGDPSMKIW